VWDLSIGGKWMQLLQEIAPDLRRIGIMYNPDTAPYAPPLVASAKATAAKGVAVFECLTRDDSEIEAAATSLGNEGHGGLLIALRRVARAVSEWWIDRDAHHRGDGSW
jgi:ABC-type uncharacterized transport system substrate-binding protein